MYGVFCYGGLDSLFFMILVIIMDYNYFNRIFCCEYILCSNLKLFYMNFIVLNWDLYYVEGFNNLLFCKIWVYGMVVVCLKFYLKFIVW